MAGMHTDGDFAWKIATGKNAMPGWRTSFTEDQIWDIVNFIQSLKSVGSKDDGPSDSH
jgi:mono/diheme cytochrome c family protein